MPGMEQPVKYWMPSIAPSGMAFYTGDLFPAWKGSLLVGALKDQMLVRLTLDGEKVTGEERLLQGLRERIRDVRVGPDGAIYLVTDNSAGRVLKVVPAKWIYLSPITATAEISSIMPTAGRLCTVMVVLAGKFPSGQNSRRIGISGSSSRGSVR